MALKNVGLIQEYEKILLGKNKDFSSVYIKHNAKESEVSELLKYAFCDILGFTPEDMRDYLSPELIKRMKLKKAIDKIDYPPEFKNEKYSNLDYLASVVYPDKVKYTKKDIILSTYVKVLSGETRFPKNFFTAYEHDVYFPICLFYAIDKNLRFKAIGDLYKFFSNKERGMKFLQKVKLYQPYRKVYHDSPLNILHFGGLEYSGQQSLFEYNNARFNNLFDIYKEKYRMKQEAENAADDKRTGC